MNKALRLVQQPAQGSEFHCPLCAGEQAIYVFGSGQFRVYRCAGCTLTYSKRSARKAAGGIGAASPQALKVAYGEADHRGLIAAAEGAIFSGPVLVFANPVDDIARFIEHRGVIVGRIVGPHDFGSAGWGGPYAGVIVTDVLMQVTDPRAALAEISRHLDPGPPWS